MILSRGPNKRSILGTLCRGTSFVNPKDVGGMGFKSLHVFNKAMFMKGFMRNGGSTRSFLGSSGVEGYLR